MAISITKAAVIAALDAINDLLDAGGSLIIYGGTPPLHVQQALTGQPVLATITFDAPLWPDAVSAGGGATASAVIPPPAPASATGEATFFRLVTTGGQAVAQGSVARSAGQGDMALVSTDLVMGEDVEIASLVSRMADGT